MTVVDYNEVPRRCQASQASKHLQRIVFGDAGELLAIVAEGHTGDAHAEFGSQALRAAEINADVLMLAKNVDGIYDSDPKTNPNAKKYSEISYIDFINQGLKAMDTTAVTICMENKTPILAFGLDEDDAIVRVCSGEELGTWIR